MEAAAQYTPGALDGPTLNSLTAEVGRLTTINAAMLAALEEAQAAFRRRPMTTVDYTTQGMHERIADAIAAARGIGQNLDVTA